MRTIFLIAAVIGVTPLLGVTAEARRGATAHCDSTTAHQAQCIGTPTGGGASKKTELDKQPEMVKMLITKPEGGGPVAGGAGGGGGGGGGR